MNELCARIPIAAPETTGGEFMYMPAGINEINCKLNGQFPITAKVLVDQSGAEALNRQLTEMRAKSQHRPYFDFNHEDGEASFWPESFSWKEGAASGIYCKGEWSAPGKAAVEGKTYRSFSGVFHVDDPSRNPARIICKSDARLNMGGLVNAPAFKNNLPFWAKDSSTDNQSTLDSMKQTVAELQAKITSLTGEIAALKAKPATDTAAASELATKEMQKQLLESQHREAVLEAKITEGNKAIAKKTVEAAVTRGALAAGKAELLAKWEKDITEDPTRAVMLESIPGNEILARGQVTNGESANRLEAKEGPARIVKAYGELVAKNSKLNVDSRDKQNCAREMARLYLAEIAGKNFNAFASMPLVAADNTDGNLGTLSGTLVAQRCLELFKLEFGGIFNRISTDFSDQPAEFGQTTKTRVVLVPPIATYNTGVDAQGRTIGWVADTSQTVDAPITLDEHVGVPLGFNANMLASTMRNLFAEQAPAASYSLAKHFVEKVYALFTPANYNAYGVVNGVFVPVAYPSFKVGLNALSRRTCTKISSIFNPNQVPVPNRTMLLNSSAFEQLSNDPSLTTFYAGQRAPEIITDNELPKLGTFLPIEAPNLQNNNATPNLLGIALHKAGVLIKSRLSNDYTTILPGANYGSVTTITDPDTNMSVMLVQYVNHDGGTANWRIQAMIGAAVGDNRGGLCILSQ